MALEDFLPGIAAHVARVEEREIVDIRDALETTLKSAIEEAGKGVALQMDWYTCVGRKVWAKATDNATVERLQDTVKIY